MTIRARRRSVFRIAQLLGTLVLVSAGGLGYAGWTNDLPIISAQSKREPTARTSAALPPSMQSLFSWLLKKDISKTPPIESMKRAMQWGAARGKHLVEYKVQYKLGASSIQAIYLRTNGDWRLSEVVGIQTLETQQAAMTTYNEFAQELSQRLLETPQPKPSGVRTYADQNGAYAFTLVRPKAKQGFSSHVQLRLKIN